LERIESQSRVFWQAVISRVSTRLLSLIRMETPQTKTEIIQAIQDLPDDATLEDAMERLYFLAKIERGLAQSDADETISHAEIKARFQR
jgi:hypothetical protein